VAHFLSTWAFEPVPTVGMLMIVGWYLWAVRRVRGARGPAAWPRRRVGYFLSAMGLLLLVICGPIGAYDGVFFWAHMVQHIAIMMVIAPLLLLGAPVLLLLEVSSRATRKRWLIPILRSRAMRLLSRPVLTWGLFAGALLGTHFTPFYNYALTHDAVHVYVEHPLYLGVALLYFYPLVGANPVPHGPAPLVKVVSLVLMMAPESMTGFFIYAASRVLYPAYAVVDRPFGPAPLADQQLGGALMWCSGMLIDAVWIAMAVQAWLRAEARAGRRIDRQLALEGYGSVQGSVPGSVAG
jgi:putative membrane protein